MSPNSRNKDFSSFFAWWWKDPDMETDPDQYLWLTDPDPEDQKFLDPTRLRIQNTGFNLTLHPEIPAFKGSGVKKEYLCWLWALGGTTVNGGMDI